MVRDKFEYLAFTCHSRPCVTYSSFALSSVLMISLQPSVDVLGVQDDSNGMLVCGLTNNSCHGIANMKVHAGPQKAPTVLLSVKLKHRNPMPQFILMKENQ